jgi:hypothetical protein
MVSAALIDAVRCASQRMLSGLVAKRVDVLGAAARGIAGRATSAAVCPGYVRTPLVEEQIADY